MVPVRAPPTARVAAVVIRIAPGLELPDDVVTQAIAIIARKGAGKTYTGKVLVEEVVKSHMPVVILDPTGAWWGLRSSRSGDKPGLPVVIFGGDHGDVPLEPTAGRVIADQVIDHPGAYVLDVSAFDSRASEVRFAADFLERLYRAKKADGGPLMLVVDEADLFAPQRPGTDQLRSLGALESIVRRGRIKGLGDVLITQRAAVLNKNVLTQSEVLIALQTTGPQDRAAIDDWLRDAASVEDRQAIAASLPSLAQGEAWLWSPSWLRRLERIRIRQAETWDSSRTPTAGEAIAAPRAYAKVDLAKLNDRIAATVEQAKANDPAELRRRIAELEGKLRGTEAALKAALAKPATIERVEVPVPFVPDAILEDLRAIRHRADLGITTATGIPAAPSAPRSAPVIPAPVDNRSVGKPGVVVRHGEQDHAGNGQVRTEAPSVGHDGASPSIGKGERAILGVLAQFPQGRTVSQLAILTGYSSSGGRFRNLMGGLRSAGLITAAGDHRALTDAGSEAIAGQWEPLPTGSELRAQWGRRLGKGEGLILEALAAAYPNSMAPADLAAATGYEATGGRFRNLLGELRTLELIDRGEPRLSDTLA